MVAAAIDRSALIAKLREEADYYSEEGTLDVVQTLRAAADLLETDGKDAERYRWLKARLLGADFECSAIEPGAGWALTFHMPEGATVSADLDATIDAVIEDIDRGR